MNRNQSNLKIKRLINRRQPKKSNKTFDSLTDDSLLELFKYFNNDQLLNAMKICQRWKDLIKNSSSLMKRMSLSVCPATMDDITTNYEKLPYRELIVSTIGNDYDENEAFVPKFSSFFANSLESVEVVKVYANSMPFIIQLLPKMTNLTTLTLTAIKQLDWEELKTFRITFPNLKHLSVSRATNIFAYLVAFDIECLLVTDVFPNVRNEIINRFLKNCHKLETLELVGFIPHLKDVSLYEFKLKSLILIHKCKPEPNTSSMLKLLQLQKDTLKFLLTVGFSTKTFAEYALNSMNLTSICVDLSKVTTEFTNLRTNNTIKEIIVLTDKSSTNLLSFCNNVDTFYFIAKLSFIFYDWLRVVAIKPNIRSLFIKRELPEYFPRNFPVMYNIESLTVNVIRTYGQIRTWIFLITNCPNVKKITVTSWIVPPEDAGISELPTALLKLKELEEIDIRGKFPMSLNFATIFARCQKKFKYLKKFTLETKMNDEMMEILAKFHKTKLRIVCVDPPNVVRGITRRFPDN